MLRSKQRMFLEHTHLAQIAQEVRFLLDLRCEGTKADYKVSKVRKDSPGGLQRKRDLSETQACC